MRTGRQADRRTERLLLVQSLCVFASIWRRRPPLSPYFLYFYHRCSCAGASISRRACSAVIASPEVRRTLLNARCRSLKGRRTRASVAAQAAAATAAAAANEWLAARCACVCVCVCVCVFSLSPRARTHASDIRLRSVLRGFVQKSVPTGMVGMCVCVTI